MVDLLIARIIAVLAMTGLAAYTDIKTGLIYDKITYSGIALGLLFNLIDFNLFGIAFAAAIFIGSYFFYYIGGIGGGDVKMFTATAMLLPFHNNFPFLLSALFFASIASIAVFSIYFVYTALKKKPETFREKMPLALMYAVCFLLAMFLLLQLNVVNPLSFLVLAGTFILASPYLAFKKEIQGQLFLQQVSVEKLEDDEIIAKEFLDEKIREKLTANAKGIFTDKDKLLLKEMGIASVPVYRGLPPFAPFFLLGVILS